MCGSKCASVHEALWIEEFPAESKCWLVIWIVALFEKHFNRGTGISIETLGNTLFGQIDGGF